MNTTKLQGFECFWCKGIHLNKASDDKYICKSCGNVNYKLDNSDNVKFIMASTYMARYNYEKADSIYKELSESENTKTKAQALFGRLLAFFGVTYIKDFNGSLVVTFSNYKPEFSSIAECSYYKDIINSEYKDEYISKLKELDKEYKRIKLELDKGIKYDVFICTKISLKTKDNPNIEGYTQDSKYANILYDELTKKGLKVFYSDKVLSGIDYDAQIYSALMRSEKILVISSKREYLESSWVQSEWERWINFIKEDVKDKDSLYLFVPNNVPIELPLKLEKTQKFTSELDLVNRLTGNKSISKNSSNNKINDYTNKYHRCEIELEYGNFDKVERMVENLLDDYPEDARLYILLLLCELKLKKESDLENHNKPLTNYQNFNKAIRFGEKVYKDILNSYNEEVIKKINEKEREIVEKLKKEKERKELERAQAIKKQRDDAQRRAKEDEERREKEETERKRKNERIKKNLRIYISTILVIGVIITLVALLIPKTTYEFGRYPQTQITDTALINTLQNINNTNELGYIEYNDNEYKEYKGNFYLVEPIKWRILESNNNTYKLVSDVILDQSVFYEHWSDRIINNNTIYPNNYEYSNIRAWLNGYDGTSYNADNYTGIGFIDIAFTEEERKLINVTNVDNSASTTDSSNNQYAGNVTRDKIYLLSFQDAESIYFTSNYERKAKVTDYAKARGVSEYNGYGDFWLRSPHVSNSSFAYYVFSDGNVYSFDCYYSDTGARPALEITIK